MDININQAEVLPRSGIPIAAGLENVYICGAALRSRIIASTSWRRERTIAFFSMSKTVLVEREAACILYRVR